MRRTLVITSVILSFGEQSSIKINMFCICFGDRCLRYAWNISPKNTITRLDPKCDPKSAVKWPQKAYIV